MSEVENEKKEEQPELSIDKDTKALVIGDDSAKVENGQGSDSSKQPPAKKKRSADRQITKDDDDDNDDDESDALKHGFKRASEEVLKRRKIFKVRRPSSNAVPTNKTIASKGSTNPFASTTLSASAGPTSGAKRKADDEKPNDNPFASTILTASSSTSSNKQPKVFGSGSAFSGFKTAIASNGGFGSASSGGFGSSTGGGFGSGFGGFGSSTSTGSTGFGEPNSSGGFSKPDAATSNTSNLFGAASSSLGQTSLSSTIDAGSIFQKPSGDAKSAFKFGLPKQRETSNEIDYGVDTPEELASSNAPVVKLPDHIELTTGEEDEELIHDGRCKSYHWVPKEEKADNSAEAGMSTTTKGNLSVKPSTEFQAAISISKEDDNLKSETTNEKRSLEAMEDNDGDGGKEKDEGSAGKKRKLSANSFNTDSADATAAKTSTSSSKYQEFRWQELGIGPIKILHSLSKKGRFRVVQRRESTKNGPATKVILNVPLWKESIAERGDSPNVVSLKTLVDNKVELYSLKFAKDTSDANYFLHYLVDNIAKAKSAFATTVE